MILFAEVVYRIFQFIILVVIVDVVLSYFLSPFHQVRLVLDRFVEPMLRPIRRIIPPTSGLDFSPIVLIIFLQIAGSIVRTILLSF